MSEATFQAARVRFETLRFALANTPRWSADGRSVMSERGGEQYRQDWKGETCRLAPETLNTAVAPEPARLFMRETYLVPEFPMPEARSPDGTCFASIRDGELFLRTGGDGDGHALTTGATDAVAWDLETVGADPWSPNGRAIFACRMDRSDVGRQPRTRFAPKGKVAVDFPRVQRAGTPIDVPQPHIVSIDDQPPRLIALDDRHDTFVRLVGWMPDGRSVVFACFSRLLDRVDLFEAEAATGTARCFFSETSPTFLRHSTIVWTEPLGCVLITGRRFAWLSTREKCTHLYVGHLDGGDLLRLTHGAMVVHAVLYADETWIWFTASVDGPRPYDRHLFRAALSGDTCQRLTESEGDHDVRFSPAGSQFIDLCSTPSIPPSTCVRRADGTKLVELSPFDPMPLLGAGWHAPQEITTLAADGATELHGVLYRPDHLDPTGSYPLVHWLYGGPQLVAAPHRFGPANANHVLFHALAAVGYAVFVTDARGTPGRSKAFQDVVWRSFAPHVVADQTAALRQLLAANGWIDPGRIGVMGRSWGAHFALRLMAHAPDLYRAGVLVVPGLDPYGGLIYEPYLGLPQDEPAAYAEAEPWALVSKLDPGARLLLMAGTLDSPCQWDMQRLSTLLVDAEIRHHLLTFAEQEHVFEGAALRFHDRAVRDFFDEALA